MIPDDHDSMLIDTTHNTMYKKIAKLCAIVHIHFDLFMM